MGVASGLHLEQLLLDRPVQMASGSSLKTRESIVDRKTSSLFDHISAPKKRSVLSPGR